MIRAAVLDDEHIIADDLSRQLSRRSDWTVLGTFLDPHGLRAFVTQNAVDVCFLDIEMSGLDGLALARELRDLAPGLLFVFVTAYHQYAATAFRVDAVDYLVKPATPEAISEACSRVEARIGAAPQPLPTKFAVLSAGRIDYVAVQDVIAAKAAGNYVALLTKNGEFLHRITLTELSDTLTTMGFLRTHRSHLVRPSAIVSARTRGDDIIEVLLTNGMSAPVSETYREQIAAMLAASALQHRS